MGHVHISNLISASREEVFEYLVDLEKLISDLQPELELSLALVGDVTSHAQALASQPPSGLPAIRPQAEIPIAIRRLGVTAHGMIRIERANRPTELSYCQEAGWFRNWRHTIRLDDHGDGKSTLMTDLLDYRLPFGIFGTLADDLFFKRNLVLILNDRASRIRAYFESLPTRMSDSVVGDSQKMAQEKKFDGSSKFDVSSVTHS